MSILQAIQYIIQGWNNVTAETIYNCWQYTKILSIDTNVNSNFPLDDYKMSNEFTNTLKTLNFSDMMELEEFFNIPEENKFLIMMKLLQKLKKKPNEKNINDDLNEIDNSIEEEVINFSVTSKSLKKVHTQQEYAYEHLNW
ncbi:unnamed protein product [Rhizophagus irregularis]|uniref:DDE-1 domain-containing protein n=1 Tax=Rhizophagus irregularis TaxID=588596 RepID=A0A916DY69_9GLOM|nr:unnamed protein product [Rhizophagus irregularis]